MIAIRRLSMPVVVALALAGGAAGADDFDWSGVYLGAHASGVWKLQDTSLAVTNVPGNAYFFQPAVAGVTDQGSPGLDDRGLGLGAQLGWDQQSGGFVWGLEVDFDWFNIGGTDWLEIEAGHGNTANYTTNGEPYRLHVESQMDWLFTTRLRLGWAVDNWLTYLTGGLALANVQFEQTFAEPPFTPMAVDATDDRTEVGWSAGAGTEIGFGGHWSARLEYLYARFDPEDVHRRLVSPLGSADFDNNVGDIQLHMLRLGLNYRF